VALLIQRALVFANPASRRGKRLAERARQALASRSIAGEIIYTERPGHAAELAREHGHRYDAVFALGGDGTVMEVAGALSGSDVLVGVLAGGTGNLLARALGIPLRVDRAVSALAAGGELRVDLVRSSVSRGQDGCLLLVQYVEVTLDARTLRGGVNPRECLQPVDPGA
jgi:diacylglycerol kinase family enzyme